MYLPKSKQKAGGKPPGKLVDPKTGLAFLGAFVKDHLGNFFKGSKITSKSQPLELIPEDTEDPKSTFVNVKRTPSEKDYTKGSFTRFFAKDGRTGKVVELDKEKYLDQRKQGKLYRRTLKIEWYVTGDPEDQIINGYLYPGTKAKNQDVINQAEKILPGIGEQILKDPSQFVRK